MGEWTISNVLLCCIVYSITPRRKWLMLQEQSKLQAHRENDIGSLSPKKSQDVWKNQYSSNGELCSITHAIPKIYSMDTGSKHFLLTINYPPPHIVITHYTPIENPGQQSDSISAYTFI